MKPRLLLSIGALALASMPAFGAFITFGSPDAAYLSSTTKIDISGLPLFSSQASITDGVQTVSFSSNGSVRHVPGSGWATWSAPPNSEEATPWVLFFGSSLTMTLATPVSVFGFEAEPDPFDLRTISASFYSGATLLGNVTRSVNGNAGARLFAASDSGIDRVVVSSTADFAAGQFRYALDGAGVPEPSSVALGGVGIAVLAIARRRRQA